MNAVKMLGLAMIVAGAVGLAYRSFSYTSETHDVKMGPIEFSMKEKKTVDIPIWAGLGTVIIGGMLLAFGGRK